VRRQPSGAADEWTRLPYRRHEPCPHEHGGRLVFERPPSTRGRLVRRLTLFVVADAAAGVALSAMTRTLWPAVAAPTVGTAAAALLLDRRRTTVERFVVSQDGFEVVTHSGRRVAVAWDPVVWLESHAAPSVAGLRRRRLIVDRRDAGPIRLPADLADLDQLVALIHARRRR
jgi:hypothetical protein